jgi:hypothetical protein
MANSPLELLAKARIAEYRERALANSRAPRHHPGLFAAKKPAVRHVRDAQRRLAGADPS